MRQNSSALQHSTLADNDETRPATSSGIKATNGEKGHRGSVAKSKEILEEQGLRMDIDGVEKETKKQDEDRADVKRDETARTEEGGTEMLRSSSRALKVAGPAFDGDSIAMSRTRSNGVRASTETVTHPHKANVRNVEGRSHSRSGSNQHILRQIASFNRSPVSSRRELATDGDDTSSDEDDEDDDGDDDKEDQSGSKRRAVSTRSKARSADGDGHNGEAENVYAGEEVEEEEENDHDPDDPNEPKYCYCGRGSYGQMIACDNDNCEKEWFHLECTGLRTAPGENGKPLLQLLLEFFDADNRQ